MRCFPLAVLATVAPFAALAQPLLLLIRVRPERQVDTSTLCRFAFYACRLCGGGMCKPSLHPHQADDDSGARGTHHRTESAHQRLRGHAPHRQWSRNRADDLWICMLIRSRSPTTKGVAADRCTCFGRSCMQHSTKSPTASPTTPATKSRVGRRYILGH